MRLQTVCSFVSAVPNEFSGTAEFPRVFRVLPENDRLLQTDERVNCGSVEVDREYVNKW